jgi:hypothetical protein
MIGLGVRAAGNALNVNKNTAHRAFGSLVTHGFIVAASPGSFHVKYRLATEWLLNGEQDDRTGAPTMSEFMRWSPAHKKTTVPVMVRSVPDQGPRGTRIPQIVGDGTARRTAGPFSARAGSR